MIQARHTLEYLIDLIRDDPEWWSTLSHEDKVEFSKLQSTCEQFIDIVNEY